MFRFLNVVVYRRFWFVKDFEKYGVEGYLVKIGTKCHYLVLFTIKSGWYVELKKVHSSLHPISLSV